VKFHLNTTLFSCESGQALEQLAQRGYGISISGDIQNLTGCRSGQSTLADPALRKGLDHMISRDPCQPQPFCDVTPEIFPLLHREKVEFYY